jgi:AraC-like DNA-binding protein
MRSRAALPPETPFRNPRLARVGLEHLTLEELAARDAGRGMVGRVERAQFFMLLRVTGGSGQHYVDFRALSLRPGQLVLVRPGQVQQWRLTRELRGDLLLVDPAVLQPKRGTGAFAMSDLLQVQDWPGRLSLSAREMQDWDRLADLLRDELSAPTIDDLGTVLARELFHCLMLRLARVVRRQDPGKERTALDTLYRRFLDQLEATLSGRPTVDAIARRLGVSTSTLNRASHAGSGRSAKSVIDGRIALEAQRLLVHSGAASAVIGMELGFSEPTNFLKFFRRTVGQTPEMFRRRHRTV